MNDGSIRELLRIVSEADASAMAPPEIELRLRKKFRSHRRRRVGRQALVWGSAAVAAAILVIALGNLSQPKVPDGAPERVAVSGTGAGETPTPALPAVREIPVP